MKILLAIAVVTSLFVVGLAQVPSQQCLNRARDLASCLSSFDGDSYCNDCANKLINYYRECTNGVGVEAVQGRKLIKTSSYILLM